MIIHVHRVYLLYFPERKKIFVNDLGSPERKVFQHTIVNKNNFFKKLVNIILGVSENLVNILGGLRKWPDMITLRHKS